VLADHNAERIARGIGGGAGYSRYLISFGVLEPEQPPQPAALRLR
jgi:hypothetical protein